MSYSSVDTEQTMRKLCKTLYADPEGTAQTLTVLTLTKSQGLKKLPKVFGERMVNLEELNLRDTPNLTALPEDLGSCAQLKKLVLWDCKNLTLLPESICQLGNLE